MATFPHSKRGRFYAISRLHFDSLGISHIGNRREWRKRFEVCFPISVEREEYLAWLKDEKEDAVVKDVRKEMFEEFCRLGWIPRFRRSEHLWRTRGNYFGLKTVNDLKVF